VWLVYQIGGLYGTAYPLGRYLVGALRHHRASQKSHKIALTSPYPRDAPMPPLPKNSVYIPILSRWKTVEIKIIYSLEKALKSIQYSW